MKVDHDMKENSVRYENRRPDETVNYSQEHPLKEFTGLLVTVFGSLLLLATVIGYAAGPLALRLSHEREQAYADPIRKHWQERSLTPPQQAAQDELRRIAAPLIKAMSLPPDQTITVSYSPDPIPNAMAMLGGQVVMYQGLLDHLNSEDAVAMVLGHEIAHARYRHPLAAAGRGVAVGLLLSLVSAGFGQQVGGQSLQQAAVLPLLHYNREQESEADRLGLHALAAVYGHVAGAEEVYTVLAKLAPRSEAAELLHTHPHAHTRLQNLRQEAQQQGWRLQGTLRPIPAALRARK